WPGPKTPEPSPDKTPLKSMRSQPVQITIREDSNATQADLLPDDTGGAILSIPPGALARLTLTPTLNSLKCTARFADGILANPSQGVPYSFLVETADAALPNDQDLRAALSVDSTDDELTFKLRVDAGNPPNKFRNIRSANLR